MMKARTSLRDGMKEARRGLMRALREARAGRAGATQVAARSNIMIVHNSGQPGSQVHATSTQHAPIVQTKGTGGDPAKRSNKEQP
jgi:hypothetical protein